ncbi:MAG: hypothetical protein RMJ98_02900 [Myxococcales bacterium]|nr:hypothetical protein [Polyangiaceae bacterium]MDW8248238.1 hypothetical protein [Myxococcales bacterium]
MQHHYFLAGILLLAACGGSTESDLGSTQPAAAGSAGASGGGGNNTGGNAGANPAGSGGSTGAGGGPSGAGGEDAGSGGSIAGIGGSTAGEAGSGGMGPAGSSGWSGTSGQSGAGQGGNGGQPQDCAPPADPTKAAVCLILTPEAMDFVEDDPQLDGEGILFVAAYDMPLPDNDEGPQDDTPPIASTVYPPQPSSGAALVSLGALPTIRLDGLPSKVYLRALFFDNLEALEKGNISWGVWFGGQDLNKGLTPNLPIDEQSLPIGKGTTRSMPLTALRRLEVTVKLASTTQPVDDGSGPFRWFAFAQQGVQEKTPLLGLSSERCLSLPANPAPVVRGLVVGSGDRFILGSLNDFNLPDPLAQGSILNATFAPGQVSIVGGKISLGPQEYRKAHSIDLSLVVPLSGPPKPPSYTCP